jgi:hypothetical protein
VETLRDRALDSNSLYDLPEDHVAVAPVSNRKKRPSPQLNKGRSVSLGLSWQFEDEGDLGYQNAAFRESPPKRRKSAPSKRSKSMKIPEPVAFTQIWEHREETATIQQSHDAKPETHDSQLTTPPESGKRTKNKSKSAISKNKQKQISIFQKPTIIKPSAFHSKQSNQEPRLHAISNHQGWTTTEDAVKLNSNGPTKTTLEKLASFRYIPSPYDKDAASPGPPQNELATSHPDSDLQHDRLVQPRTTHPSLDYDLVRTNDSLFNEAMRNDKMSSDSIIYELVEPVPSHHATKDHVEMSKNVALASGDPAAQLDLPDKLNNPRVGLVERDRDNSTQVVPLPIESSQRSEYDEPTSSEAMILNGLLKDVDMVELDERGVVDVPRSIFVVPERALTAHQQDVGSEPSADEIVQYATEDNVRVFKTESAGMDGLEDLLPHQQPINTGNPMNIRHRRRLVQVQVERSDVDDYEVTPNQGSKDLYDVDEFDEGLEEDDFLAMVSDVVVPETPSKVRSQQQSSKQGSSQALSNSFVSARPILMEYASGNPNTSPRDKVVHPPVPSPRILTSESGDEFPMNEGDEQEMLKLPELATDVNECLATPAGLSLPSHDESDGREVYDPSLKYSPLISRSGWPLNKVADGHYADNNSAHRSSNDRFEIENGLLEDDEDWVFIRAAHGAQMPDPFVDPQLAATSPQRSESRLELSSSYILQARKLPAYRRTHSSAAEMTSDTVWSIIDDSHEYLKLKPFARPDFPSLVPDRCPVIGVSAQAFLRTCFRIGEMFKEGARRNALGQDVVIELFARVTFSSRDAGTTTQHFQFADLWHDRPPFPNGVLMNYRATGLAESESKVFIETDGEKMARCLGRLKRDTKSNIGWLLHIINIRTTDWEEILFTKNAVCRGLVKSEMSKL